jgi:hypothetical protein
MCGIKRSLNRVTVIRLPCNIDQAFYSQEWGYAQREFYKENIGYNIIISAARI